MDNEISISTLNDQTEENNDLLDIAKYNDDITRASTWAGQLDSAGCGP